MTAPVSHAPFPLPAAGRASGPAASSGSGPAAETAVGAAPVTVRSEKGKGAPKESFFATVLASMAAQPLQPQLPALPAGLVPEGAGSADPVAGGPPAGHQAFWAAVPTPPVAAQAPLFETASPPVPADPMAEVAAAMAVTAEPPTGSPETVQDGAAVLPPNQAPPVIDLPVDPGEAHPAGSPAARPEGEALTPLLHLEGEPRTGEARPDPRRIPSGSDPAVVPGPDRDVPAFRAPESRLAGEPGADPRRLTDPALSEQPWEPARDAAEPAAPTPGRQDAHPLHGQPAQPAGADQVQPDQPVGQPRPLAQLSGRYEPRQLVDDLVRAVTTLEDGQYSVTLRLHPEHLGEVRLQIQMSGRQVHAAMEVANPEARQLLENRSDQLRQSLDQAGLTLAGFEVHTGQHHRQSLRERHEALAESLAQGFRRIQPTGGPTAAAVNRIRTTDRRGGRLDTMA